MNLADNNITVAFQCTVTLGESECTALTRFFLGSKQAPRSVDEIYKLLRDAANLPSLSTIDIHHLQSVARQLQAKLAKMDKIRAVIGAAEIVEDVQEALE